MKTVWVLGADGYLGWPMTLYLLKRGYRVLAIDNCIKRQWEMVVGGEVVVPIATWAHRCQFARDKYADRFSAASIDIAKQDQALFRLFETQTPDAIIHFAEQPSAPFSMSCRANAIETQVNNIVGTLNVAFGIAKYNRDCHLIKLGTMGEYGTPDHVITEGPLPVQVETSPGTKQWRMIPMPKHPGSFYHLSKVHDSANLEFCVKNWDLRVTDINQGPVYGFDTDEVAPDNTLPERTAFHYDSIFGTVINRFIVQAASRYPLTVYGSGLQTRGYINLRDTLRCLEIAIENPAEAGEFRIFNQINERISVIHLAELVKEAGRLVGLDVKIQHLENPRNECEAHEYHVVADKLKNLGWTPVKLSPAGLADMLLVVMECGAPKIGAQAGNFLPNIVWDLRASARNAPKVKRLE